ncbi:TIGR02678 family protein [Amphibacillus indicireducens]|uniref:TIGR02678 family protein n=1 Tax=Amphibacillus indicireducens TaxID=1076330 RepID=A0ABP7V9G7_9BACI
MKPEELRRALKLLFENFWIIRSRDPENYNFLRRHQSDLKKELNQRFGMNLMIRSQYIQLLKRPHILAPWMGASGFTAQLDYVLFCCCMAYTEGLEADTPFMLDELINGLDLMIPEEVVIDWTNYNHRKSLVRAIKKMLELTVIENIQGETGMFERSEENQEVLYTTTAQARAFLARAPQSYMEYQGFEDYWADIQANRNLEGNQLLYQRLMMEPALKRTEENEQTFVRLRNYYHHMKDYVETNTHFYYELYQDYAAFTLENRDNWQEIFPSRRVIDEILIQLATLLREQAIEFSRYGVEKLTESAWQELLERLKRDYQHYWSKEFTEMSIDQLSEALLARGADWQLFDREDQQILIQPAFGRLVAEMRQEDE